MRTSRSIVKKKKKFSTSKVKSRKGVVGKKRGINPVVEWGKTAP